MASADVVPTIERFFAEIVLERGHIGSVHVWYCRKCDDIYCVQPDSMYRCLCAWLGHENLCVSCGSDIAESPTKGFGEFESAEAAIRYLAGKRPMGMENVE